MVAMPIQPLKSKFMAKRFIDTGLFDDEWFMNLSKDGKLLWIYLITKCDHAGIIEANEKLIEFQTGIESFANTSIELGKRLFYIKECYYFIPKYIDFQYPNFPNSRVRQQGSAIKILVKFGLFDEDASTFIKDIANPSLRVTKGLPKPSRKAPEQKKDVQKAPKFQKPTLNDVTEYCKERSNKVDPEAWINFYTSNGWKVGKNPMKDWKAAVRTWERNGINNKTNEQGKSSKGGHSQVPADTSKSGFTSTL